MFVMFAGYGFVFTIFCSSRNCKYFVSVRQNYLFDAFAFFLLFLPGVPFAVKEKVFLWITTFLCPRGISAITSRSNALVHSSKLEQCPYFVFHVRAQDDLGCGTFFVLAITALSRQVITNTLVPDSQGAPASPSSSQVSKTQRPPKKGLNFGKAFDRYFLCKSKPPPSVLPLQNALKTI